MLAVCTLTGCKAVRNGVWNDLPGLNPEFTICSAVSSGLMSSTVSYGAKASRWFSPSIQHSPSSVSQRAHRLKAEATLGHQISTAIYIYIYLLFFIFFGNSSENQYYLVHFFFFIYIFIFTLIFKVFIDLTFFGLYTLTKTFVFSPLFSWAELKDLRLFLCTQKAYFSQILFTNLSKSVLVSTSPLPR